MRASVNAPDPVHVRTVLGRSELFGILSPDDREQVLAELEWRYVPGGDAVYRPGDPSDALYLVIHGRVRVFWDLDGSGTMDADEAVDDIGEGGIIGDIGMLSDDPHGSLVLAIRDTELGRLSEARFWALCDRFPGLARRIGHHAVRRLQSALKPPVPPERVNVAVVPLDAATPVRAFAAALAGALGALAVHAEGFDRELGAGASADDVDQWDEVDRRIVRWICEQERRHRYILYETDAQWTPWTRRCLRMADRLVVVARADADPDLGEVEARLQPVDGGPALVPMDLVLVHPDDRGLPTGTDRWLRPRTRLDRVHHVRLGDPESLRRVARLVAGRGVGVVLGGGGARGTAQMGAVQALRDVGIPIDWVGGTSAGGGVAAMVALGWDLRP